MPAPASPLHTLAEALCPLMHDLTAGLLLRPAPVAGEPPLSRTGTETLCRDLDGLLEAAVPALREALEELHGADPDDLDELAEELAAPALDLVDMARRIWEAPLPREAEGARTLLATLAEAPATHLLGWLHKLMHAVIDPHAVLSNPEKPTLDFTLDIPDAPVREALTLWRQTHPGVLPDDVAL